MLQEYGREKFHAVETVRWQFDFATIPNVPVGIEYTLRQQKTYWIKHTLSNFNSVLPFLFLLL